MNPDLTDAQYDPPCDMCGGDPCGCDCYQATTDQPALPASCAKQYTFQTASTPQVCRVTMTRPNGSVIVKQFRKGYVDATVSAHKWIAEQLEAIEHCCEEGGYETPSFYVDGVRVTRCQSPRLSECIRLLERIVKYVNDRGPDGGELFEASCDAEELIARFRASQQGRFEPHSATLANQV